MRRFKNILVVAPVHVDTEATLDLAAELAAANGARLTLFDVVTPFSSQRRAVLNAELSQFLQDKIVEQRELGLEELARRVTAARPAVAVGVGTPFLEIVRRVMRNGHDLVITPPDQPSDSAGLGRASTTLHLLRKCPVPVWVHRAEGRERTDVVAAVGPFPEDEPTPLDYKLVELASSLAGRLGGHLHLVHAWQLEGETLLRRGRVKLPANEVDVLVDEAEAAAQEATAKLLANSGLTESRHSLHVLKSRPAAAIVDVANAVQPAAVVMGTASRGGITGLLIGNTAETVAAQLGYSVLAVKPDGYTSPVEP